MFKRFPSIERLENLEKMLDKYYPEFNKDEILTWSVTEKLHGSNICVSIKRDETNVYSRNGHKVSESIESAVLNSFKDLKLEKNVEGVFYGEIVGEGIQKGVDYGKEKKFYFIESIFTYSPTGYKCRYNAPLLVGYLNGKNEFVVPIIKHCHASFNAIKTWANSFLNTDPITEVNEQSNSIIEGIVCEAYADSINKNLKFKLHHNTFEERKSKKKDYVELCKATQELSDRIVLEYLTSARVSSAMSKWPEYTKQQISCVLKELVNDVKKEIEKDGGEWSKSFSKIISDYGKNKIILNAKKEA